MNAIEQLVLDENNIAFHPMMGNSYQLNPIAKEIVYAIKEQKSKDEIVVSLSTKYDVNEEELFIDISDFFSKLKVYGLL